MSASNFMSAQLSPSVYRVSPAEVHFERNRRNERKVLGTGANGVVYAAKYAGEEVAVKVLKTGPGGLGPEDEALFWREAELQYSLRNDHIVAVLGAYVDDTFPEEPPEHAVIMQRMSGSLSELLYKSSPPQLSRRLQISTQVGFTAQC
jgi:serine/threonine protein kinase